MKTMSVFGLAAAVFTAFFLFSPAVAHAQRSGAAMRVSSVRARPVGAHVMANPGSRVAAAAPFLGSAPFLPFSGSLGFNFANFTPFGGSGDFGIEAAIDPATQWRIFEAERFLRGTRGVGFNSGVFLLDGGGEYVVPESASTNDGSQQPVIVVQQAPSQQSGAQAASDESAESAPLPDVGQFTLVLKDGSKIQAVAFTEAGGRIIYITADGSRRTIAASALDANATKELNEERGTPLQLSL
jgi:hypothetical protein